MVREGINLYLHQLSYFAEGDEDFQQQLYHASPMENFTSNSSNSTSQQSVTNGLKSVYMHIDVIIIFRFLFLKSHTSKIAWLRMRHFDQFSM